MGKSGGEVPYHQSLFEELKEGKKIKEPNLELKVLPPYLKYVFLAGNSKKPVIISSSLFDQQEKKSVKIFEENIKVIGWTLYDLKGISTSYCMHMILMEEVFRKEVVWLLEVGMIYLVTNQLSMKVW